MQFLGQAIWNQLKSRINKSIKLTDSWIQKRYLTKFEIEFHYFLSVFKKSNQNNHSIFSWNSFCSFEISRWTLTEVKAISDISHVCPYHCNQEINSAISSFFLRSSLFSSVILCRKSNTFFNSTHCKFMNVLYTLLLMANKILDIWINR